MYVHVLFYRKLSKKSISKLLANTCATFSLCKFLLDTLVTISFVVINDDARLVIDNEHDADNDDDDAGDNGVILVAAVVAGISVDLDLSALMMPMPLLATAAASTSTQVVVLVGAAAAINVNVAAVEPVSGEFIFW